MKLPKNYFEGLAAAKYREYLKLLPDIKKENTQLITVLIFTFAALSFLGIFAINPTLTTIVDLKKQLADSEFVHQQLSAKIANLGSLQQKYTALNPDLPVVYDAIPQSPTIPLLVGQIQALAKKSNTHLTSIHVSEVQMAGGKGKPDGLSFVFALDGTGAYDDVLNFAFSLSHFSRMVTVEAISVEKDEKKNLLVLSIKGRAYFKD